MKSIVIFKSRYGSTRAYAHLIAERLGCNAYDAKKIKSDDLFRYDGIIYGGGLYAEIINGVSLITKNIDKLHGKKIAIFSTGITPLDKREYYDDYVINKNFKPEMLEKIKVFNFMGKMVMDELTVPHRAAIKTLKKIISLKENQTEMEKLLIELCDTNGDFTDPDSIEELIEYFKS